MRPDDALRLHLHELGPAAARANRVRIMDGHSVDPGAGRAGSGAPTAPWRVNLPPAKAKTIRTAGGAPVGTSPSGFRRSRRKKLDRVN